MKTIIIDNHACHILNDTDKENIIYWGMQPDSKSQAEKVNIITKGCHHDDSCKRVTSKDLFADIDTSLCELDTDYIDLYLLHRDDESKPVSDIIEALISIAESTLEIITFKFNVIGLAPSALIHELIIYFARSSIEYSLF